MSPLSLEYARDAPKTKCLSNVENKVRAKNYQANEIRKEAGVPRYYELNVEDLLLSEKGVMCKDA